MIMNKLSKFEELALADKDVKFGFDNYDVLKQIGSLVREMRVSGGFSQTALQEMSGIPQADISRVESGTMERGPSLLTLVRLAHAAGKRLVIGLEDEEGEDKKTTRVLAL
jgi:transcriptional regulator with XRE-family HTH domain